MIGSNSRNTAYKLSTAMAKNAVQAYILTWVCIKIDVEREKNLRNNAVFCESGSSLMKRTNPSCTQRWSASTQRHDAVFILFEVGISNLVCICILRRQSFPYLSRVSVTLNLTSDLVSKNCIESGAYLLHSLRYEFQIWCVNASWEDGVSHTIFWSLWPWPLT